MLEARQDSVMTFVTRPLSVPKITKLQSARSLRANIVYLQSRSRCVGADTVEALRSAEGHPFFWVYERGAGKEKKRRPQCFLLQNVLSESSHKSPWKWISKNIFPSKVSFRQEPVSKKKGCPNLNIGRNRINQRQRCVKHKSRFWPSAARQKSLAFHSFHPNSGSWHRVIGKLNYNIRLVLLLLIMCFWRPDLPPSSLPLPSPGRDAAFEI